MSERIKQWYVAMEKVVYIFLHLKLVDLAVIGTHHLKVQGLLIKHFKWVKLWSFIVTISDLSDFSKDRHFYEFFFKNVCF